MRVNLYERARKERERERERETDRDVLENIFVNHTSFEILYRVSFVRFAHFE